MQRIDRECDSAQHALLSKKLEDVTSASVTILGLSQTLLSSTDLSALSSTSSSSPLSSAVSSSPSYSQLLSSVSRLKQSVSVIRSFQSSSYERSLLSYFIDTYSAFEKHVISLPPAALHSGNKFGPPNSGSRKRSRPDDLDDRNVDLVSGAHAALDDPSPAAHGHDRESSKQDDEDECFSSSDDAPGATNNHHSVSRPPPSSDALKHASSAFQSSIMQPEQITVSWNDIKGANSAVEALQQALILPHRLPHLFENSGRRPWKCILLYGPPGTGKTMLASVAAKESNATIISVSAADLLSKWVGDSEKTVRDLFQVAKSFPKCLIFLDEIDAMCGARGNGQESESSRRLKTEFLVRMQALHNSADSKSITILAATNLPWELDAAFRRRFDRFIFVGLPDLIARTNLIQAKLQSVSHTLTNKEIAQFAESTNMLSPSDIDHVMQHAFMLPVSELCRATHFRHTSVVHNNTTDSRGLDQGEISRDVFYPCEASSTGALACSLQDLPPECVEACPVQMDHLQRALSTHVASVTKSSLQQFSDWEKSVNSVA